MRRMNESTSENSDGSTQRHNFIIAIEDVLCCDLPTVPMIKCIFSKVKYNMAKKVTIDFLTLSYDFLSNRFSSSIRTLFYS